MSFSNVKYLLDSNVFIESHNINYHPAFCQGFWDWLKLGHEQGFFYSIDKVQKELKQNAPAEKITDEITLRMQCGDIPETLFLTTLTCIEEINCYQQLMMWAKSQSFNQNAQDEFAQETEADAFLISLAKAKNYTIVTKEILVDHACKRRVKIDGASLYRY